MSSSLDSVASTFAFTLRFDPSNMVHKRLVRPLSFHNVEFLNEVTNEVYFTGQIISHQFNSKSSPELVQLSGYSSGGVLEDCTIDIKDYPLESINRSLREIAKRLLKSFGVQLIISENVKAECNQIYKKSVATPTGSVKEYLSKLAAQRNVVMSHDSKGNVVFYRPDTAAASKGFYDKSNTLNMGCDVNGQGMHNSISAIRQQSKKEPKGMFDDESESSSSVDSVDTVINPLIKVHRPFVDILSSGSNTDSSKGAKNLLAAELKNIKFGFELSRWDDINIGDIVEVQNNEVFLYNRTRLIIESLARIEDSSRKSMVVTLVLPETFTGNKPKNIFE